MIDPLVIDLADVVVTVKNEEVTVSMMLSFESVVEIVNEDEVPTYQRLVTPGTMTVIGVFAETFEAKNPLKDIVWPEFSEEHGGFELLTNVEILHPFEAVTLVSETEIPLGKLTLILPPAIILLVGVKVKLYSVFGFEATELLNPMKVGVMVLGVITNAEVLES